MQNLHPAYILLFCILLCSGCRKDPPIAPPEGQIAAGDTASSDVHFVKGNWSVGDNTTIDLDYDGVRDIDFTDQFMSSNPVNYTERIVLNSIFRDENQVSLAYSKSGSLYFQPGEMINTARDVYEHGGFSIYKYEHNGMPGGTNTYTGIWHDGLTHYIGFRIIKKDKNLVGWLLLGSQKNILGWGWREYR